MNTQDFWIQKYNQHIPSMIGVCYRYVLDRQVAEDIAHNAFLKAMEKSDSYRGIGRFKAWLTRITVNEALQYLRVEKKLPIVSDVEVDELEENTDESEDENVAEVIRCGQLTQEEILQAIAQLPVHHRTVFNLYVFENKSHKDIAEALNITVGTSKSHLARARAKLQEILITQAKHKNKIPMLVFLLFVSKAHAADRICKAALKDFVLPPQTHIELSSNVLAACPKPSLALRAASHSTSVVVGTTCAVVACVAVPLMVSSLKPTSTSPSSPQPVEIAQSVDTLYATQGIADTAGCIANEAHSSSTGVPPRVCGTHTNIAANDVPGNMVVPSAASAPSPSPAPVVVKKIQQRHVTVIMDTTGK